MLYFHKCGSFLLGDLNLLVLRRSDKPQGCRLARERAVSPRRELWDEKRESTRAKKRKKQVQYEFYTSVH